MQSSKPSKKSLKKEEEKLVETAPNNEAPKGRSRSSKAPKEKLEATSAKVHRKSPAAPATPAARVEANDPSPAKVMAAAAGAGALNGGIIDSVGVMAAAPATDAPISARVSQSTRTVSREEIAHL